MRGRYDGRIIKTVVGMLVVDGKGGKNRRDRVRVFLKGNVR